MSDTIRESCPKCGSKNLTWHQFVKNGACLDCDWSLIPFDREAPSAPKREGRDKIEHFRDADGKPTGMFAINRAPIVTEVDELRNLMIRLNLQCSLPPEEILRRLREWSAPQVPADVASSQVSDTGVQNPQSTGAGAQQEKVSAAWVADWKAALEREIDSDKPDMLHVFGIALQASRIIDRLSAQSSTP